ncbi:MAG TPA: nucleoside triphosphate pyrophosphatase [Rhizomicrobium sp.]|nr:nucleoside triphosphate pyrophosphatase [Rhizomicrobium sp.]
MSELVLASASTVRARLLKNAGVPFTVRPASIDEDTVKESLLAAHAPLRDIADALAELKALRVSNSDPAALVLGADQVLEFDGALISKCASLDEARALLQRMRGKKHTLISALVLAKGGAPIWRRVDSAQLWMRDISDSFLDAYLAREGDDLLSGVGCYRLEGRGSQLFDRIDGDYFTVLGLPLLPLLTALRQYGIIVP